MKIMILAVGTLYNLERDQHGQWHVKSFEMKWLS
jgi:hypothetical protein